jgi:hypothetical protein
VFCLFWLAHLPIGESLAEPAPAVNAHYYTSAKAARSRKVEHPVKLFKCWGQDTEWSSLLTENKVESTATFVHDQSNIASGGHPGIDAQIYEVMSYDVEFDANETFKFSFKNKYDLTRQKSWSTDCDSTTTQSSIQSGKAALTGNIEIAAPLGNFSSVIRPSASY